MKKLFALLLAVMMLMAFAVTVNAEPDEEMEEGPVLPAYDEFWVGNSVYLGNYGWESIEWAVLDVQDGQALLMSRYAVACQPYNTTHANVTWETCSLRKWLNNDFLNETFVAEEQAMIVTSTVEADANPDYLTNAGNATQDRIFLLSIDEVEQYLSKEDMSCSATMYAEEQGAFVSLDTGYCWWWLRTPGHSQDVAAGVRVNGKVVPGGDDVARKNAAVRPAMWVEIPEEPVEEPVEPEEPVEEPDEPVVPDEPVEPDEPVVPDEPVEEPEQPSDSPVTGDVTYVLAAGMLLALSAGMVTYTAKKRV